MAKQNSIVLRIWELNADVSISISDLHFVLQETVVAANLPVLINEMQESNCVIATSTLNGQYMPVGYDVDNRTHSVNVFISGKGEQIKAQDLEKLYYKGSGAWSDFCYSVRRGKAVAQRFGAGSITSTVSAGVGAAAGLAIRGGVKLIAKGIKALLRDKDAYDKEMAYYQLALGIVDFCVGGVDTADIVPLIKQQAEADNSIAQYTLGNAYSEGRGVEKNDAEALLWYEKGAANGELRCQNIVAGEYLYGETDYGVEKKETGIRYLANLADAGEEWAAQAILDIYGLGTVKGILVDAGKLHDYAVKYSDKGYLSASFVLAQICNTDIELIAGQNATLEQYKDDEKAAQLYEKVLGSRDQEHVEVSAMNLASMALTGRGVPRSESDAVRYYLIAGNCGNILAKAALVDAFTYGVGTEKSKKDALRYSNELLKSGKSEFYPVAYYSMFKFADEEEQYGDSMKQARNYMACEYAEDDKKAELQKYLADMEEKISHMTEEERREFLKEPKKFSLDPKHLKWILVGCAAIVALIIIIFAVSHINKDSGGYEDYPYEPEAEYGNDEAVLDEYDESDSYALSQGEDIITVTLSWTGRDENNDLVPLQLNVEGAADATSDYEDDSTYDRGIQTYYLYDIQKPYNISVDASYVGDDMLQTVDMESVSGEVMISFSTGEEKIISLDEAEIYRSYTGTWLWGIVLLEDGQFKSYDTSWLEDTGHALEDDTYEEESMFMTESEGDILTRDYIFPNSDSEYLSYDDLDGITEYELHVAINEIYARDHYIFSKEEWQDYFEDKSWYYGTATSMDIIEDEFNDYERANVKMMDNYKNEQGWEW